MGYRSKKHHKKAKADIRLAALSARCVQAVQEPVGLLDEAEKLIETAVRKLEKAGQINPSLSPTLVESCEKLENLQNTVYELREALVQIIESADKIDLRTALEGTVKKFRCACRGRRSLEQDDD